VAFPLYRLVMPGRTGSSWLRNCFARLAGVPLPNEAPIVPPV